MSVSSSGVVMLDNTHVILGQSNTASAVTGTTNKTALASVVIPAGMIGVNGTVRVSALFTCTNSANSKTMTIDFGGSNVLTFAGTALASIELFKYIRNRTATSQIVTNSALVGSSSSVTLTTLNIDTTAAVTLTLNGQLASAAETITLEGYTIEVLKAP